MRILLVEDNDELSSLIKVGLGWSGIAVDYVDTVEAALSAISTVAYAAYVLDIGLPDGDGLSILRELRHRHISSPVLVLTARSGLRDRIAGLEMGADDYLVKPFELEELAARLRALLRRPDHLLGLLLSCGNVALDTQARQTTVAGKLILLAPRETDVLELLMRRSGKVVAKQVIEDQLFGLSKELGSNAIEVYLHRLRKQLEEAGATTFIHTVRGVGYLLAENRM